MDKAAIVTMVSKYNDKTVSDVGKRLVERTKEVIEKGKKL